MSLIALEERLNSFGLPENLTGKRVLDVGPWDGFFTFAMEQRGAEVTAIDYVDLDTFRILHKAFESRSTYKQKDVYEIDASVDGTFDFVLLLGVLYHLKYPIEGLERICQVTLDTCIIETFVIDAADPKSESLPITEFYETDELAGQLDNWWGPSIAAVQAWARTAGFAQVDLLRTTATTACFAARRKWTKLAPPVKPALTLSGIHHHQNRGRTFHSSKEEYIEVWAQWDIDEDFHSACFYPEVDGFGVPPLAVQLIDDQVHLSIRVPFGLFPGEHQFRLRTHIHSWSSSISFSLDLPPLPVPPRIISVQDGVSWTEGMADWASGGWLTVWVQGLSQVADCGNVTVLIDEVPHIPIWVSAEDGQINLQLRPMIHSGTHRLQVLHLEKLSQAINFGVLNAPPKVKGLESL